MNLQETYQKLNGDYEDVLHRFGKEERIEKFLVMILNDDNYRVLTEALHNKDYEQAFMAIHTIKGITLNLGLKHLFHSAETLTDLLRGKEYQEGIEEAYSTFSDDYLATIEIIKTMKEQG